MPVEVFHNVMHHEPPPSAGAMRAAPEAARPAAAQAAGISAPVITRLIALPFRMLRKDDATEFLAYSLPDAIANSLARFDRLVVRASLVAARFEGQAAPARIGAEAQVTAILIGFRAYRRRLGSHRISHHLLLGNQQ